MHDSCSSSVHTFEAADDNVGITELAAMRNFTPNTFRGNSFRGNFSRGNSFRGNGRGFRRGNNFQRGGNQRPPTPKPNNPPSVFCKVCHIAGKADEVCRTHSIANCWALTRQDKQLLAGAAYMEATDGDDANQPLGPVIVPGWDDQEEETGSNFISNEIYNYSAYSRSLTNLNTIIPIASQTIKVKLSNTSFLISLDSGATVSYIRLSLVKQLGCTILPNNQLAVLADKKTRMASMGEVHETVAVDDSIIPGLKQPVILTLRALVMENLQVACFGGTTFHSDNKVVPSDSTL